MGLFGSNAFRRVGQGEACPSNRGPGSRCRCRARPLPVLPRSTDSSHSSAFCRGCRSVCRGLCLYGLACRPFLEPPVDEVFQGNEQPQPEEGAGREDRQDKPVVVVTQGEDQPAGPFAEHEVQAREEGALADQFPQTAQHHEHQDEAGADGQAVQRRARHVVTRGEGLGAADDGAVGDDERDEDAENLVQVMEPGIHAQFHGGDEGGDDQHEYRQAHLLAYPVADQGDRGVGGHQYQGGGDSQAHAVHQGVGDRQQGTEPQQCHQRLVVVPQALLDDFPVTDHFSDLSGWVHWAGSSPPAA